MRLRTGSLIYLIPACALIGFAAIPRAGAKEDDGPSPGSFTIRGPKPTIMPLQRTDVSADIDGFGARVTVKQKFKNPSSKPIEAIYTFPLPENAAVDRMTLKIGDRTINGLIKRRDEARKIYEEAKNAGQNAALLDQERPNVFTQSVANIMPGQPIEVEISYVQRLKYDGGQFEFTFPMVVGPRFLANTPDANKLSPPRVSSKVRSGQTIGLSVNLNAGAPIQELSSQLHEVKSQRDGKGGAKIELVNKQEIPNRDFILKYRVAAGGIVSSVTSNFDPAKKGFFCLSVLPPVRPTAEQIAPREVILVMDQSGSQSGFPIEKSKELTLQMLRALRKNDTFNVVGFNTTTRSLFNSPVAVTQATLAEAESFVKGMDANGGTSVEEGVLTALRNQADPRRIRLVVFNTDGYIGNEADILKAIQNNRGRARMFTFGIGNSVNRYLIEGMATVGRGASEIVVLNESADRAMERFLKRSRTPILTDVQVRFEGVNPTETVPLNLPDVFDDTPVVVFGRYAKPGAGSAIITGNLGGKPYSQTVPLNLSESASAPAIPTLWARNTIERITFEKGIQQDQPSTIADKRIENLGLQFGLMTEFTSFVAVESKVVNIGGRQQTVEVPVETPEGVADQEASRDVVPRGLSSAAGGGGFGGGGFAGVPGGPGGSGGLVNGVPASAPALVSKAAPARASERSATGDYAKRKVEIPSKIDRRLRGKKGMLKVQVLVTKLDAKTLAELKDSNLEVTGKDAGLKVVFGRIDAADLEWLARLTFITSIRPIKG